MKLFYPVTLTLKFDLLNKDLIYLTSILPEHGIVIVIIEQFVYILCFQYQKCARD